MSYRKIDVDGKEYEYVIGKTHVKIKGLGAWPKDDVGERCWNDCGCGEGFDCPDSFESIRVRPAHIATTIRWNARFINK